MDSSDNGNDGELLEGATWATGQLDGCVDLDGDDDYVELSLATLWEDMSDVTFGIWVNWTGEGDVWQRVWDCGTGTSVHTFLCIDTGSYTRFIFTIDSYNDEKQVNIDTIDTGWHHIAVTHNYSETTAIMYLDGEEVASEDEIDVGLPELMEEAGDDGLDQCWLGRSQYSADPYFSGQIDDFRIYIMRSYLKVRSRSSC